MLSNDSTKEQKSQSVNTNPIHRDPIEEVFHRMEQIQEAFTLVDGMIFPDKHHLFDLLDGIASMAKETKRQIELKA